MLYGILNSQRVYREKMLEGRAINLLLYVYSNMEATMDGERHRHKRMGRKKKKEIVILSFKHFRYAIMKI
jgi:hypothetical protein